MTAEGREPCVLVWPYRESAIINTHHMYGWYSLYTQKEGDQRKLKKMGIYVTRKKRCPSTSSSAFLLFLEAAFLPQTIKISGCVLMIHIFDEKMTVMKHIVTSKDEEQPISHLEPRRLSNLIYILGSSRTVFVVNLFKFHAKPFLTSFLFDKLFLLILNWYVVSLSIMTESLGKCVTLSASIIHVSGDLQSPPVWSVLRRVRQQKQKGH